MPAPLEQRQLSAAYCAGKTAVGQAMEPSAHLVLVKNDPDISDMVSCFMSEHGFRVSLAGNGKVLNRVMAESKIDLILLDLLLPGEYGLAICRRLRTTSNVPIIILTALGSEADRVIGLELGADDYLPKLFSTRELLARVRTVLWRSRLTVSEQQTVIFEFDHWQLDLNLRRLRSPEGAQVPLTTVEYNTLSVFCQFPRRVLSRE